MIYYWRVHTTFARSVLAIWYVLASNKSFIFLSELWHVHLTPAPKNPDAVYVEYNKGLAAMWTGVHFDI